MNILMIGSECVPFIKTGGLADVMGSLPRELVRNGTRVTVMLPYYSKIPESYKNATRRVDEFTAELGQIKRKCVIRELVSNGVRTLFLDCDECFGVDWIYGYGDFEAQRFALFCRAALESIRVLRLKPDVIHCNDWHTGMIPLLLKTQYAHDGSFRGIKTVFTIHNLRYQGLFDINCIKGLLSIPDEYFIPDRIEYYGSASFMKAGIIFSDIVTTVSQQYALEIQTQQYGEGLDGVLRQRDGALFGILNGIACDEFNPETDDALPENFSCSNLRGKTVCKDALRGAMRLDDTCDAIIGVVSRLTEQKGFELVREAAQRLMSRRVQFAVLGTGDRGTVDFFRTFAGENPGRVGYRDEYNDSLARLIYAGSDFFLMPSMFEPCGLSQLIAMRYGTLPIVRETGGLKDTVVPYNRFTGEGTGFSFAQFSADDMVGAIDRALECYADKEATHRMIVQAMSSDFSWKASAKRYIELYDKMLRRD